MLYNDSPGYEKVKLSLRDQGLLYKSCPPFFFRIAPIAVKSRQQRIRKKWI
jgi:hypothetical protein